MPTIWMQFQRFTRDGGNTIKNFRAFRASGTARKTSNISKLTKQTKQKELFGFTARGADRYSGKFRTTKDSFHG